MYRDDYDETQATCASARDLFLEADAARLQKRSLNTLESGDRVGLRLERTDHLLLGLCEILVELQNLEGRRVTESQALLLGPQRLFCRSLASLRGLHRLRG